VLGSVEVDTDGDVRGPVADLVAVTESLSSCLCK
jgi:hypothetical protein